MKKIIVTGGTGRFGNILKKYKTNNKIIFPTKSQLNILNINKIRSFLSKSKPNILIHMAGLSRPMKIHNTNIQNSIDLNVIGTANITKVCAEKNIKLIYFSTNYVYQGLKGNYKESDPIFPVNNYAWSKLGGEACVHMYKNSLILRLSMTERPFVHKKAYANVVSSFLYHDAVIKILFKVLNKKGVLNIGGKPKSIFNFAKKDNPLVKKIYLKKKTNIGVPINSSLNLSKLKKILKKK